MFIDLSKAFDTVNHKILLKKLTYFGIKGVYLDWFNSYLRNRKQFIFYNDKNSSMLDITCGVPQGSILGPLLFLLYINDLQKASSIVKPIMFADDTNIFFSDKHITSLFSTMNNELKNIQKWFNSNKLSLNASKTKYIFFHSQAHSGDIPLKLPKLEINTTTIVRESVIKFLGVLLDENLSWKTHISTIENKISKNLGILYKARLVLNQKSIKQLYFSFIHSYLNYGNMAWGSTNKTKLNQLLRHQKHASRLIFFKDKLTHAKPLLQSINALNIYQLNIFRILLFMHKVKNERTPQIFKTFFFKTNNIYNTRSCRRLTFSKPLYKTKSTQYNISFRGPHIWNSLVPTELKNLSFPIFKSKIKTMCFGITNETQYF